MANNPLTPIGSESSTTDESIRLAKLGHGYNEGPLREAIAGFRASYATYCGDHNKVKKASRPITEEEGEFINKIVRAKAFDHLQGLAFYRNVNEQSKCFGDIGIAYGISYTVFPTKTDNTVAELTLPIDSKTPDVKAYFHIRVALPNGTSTTWRLNQIERVSDEDGFSLFRAFYEKKAA